MTHMYCNASNLIINDGEEVVICLTEIQSVDEYRIGPIEVLLPFKLMATIDNSNTETVSNITGDIEEVKEYIIAKYGVQKIREKLGKNDRWNITINDIISFICRYSRTSSSIFLVWFKKRYYEMLTTTVHFDKEIFFKRLKYLEVILAKEDIDVFIEIKKIDHYAKMTNDKLHFPLISSGTVKYKESTILELIKLIWNCGPLGRSLIHHDILVVERTGYEDFHYKYHNYILNDMIEMDSEAE